MARYARRAAWHAEYDVHAKGVRVSTSTSDALLFRLLKDRLTAGNGDGGAGDVA